MAQLRQLTSSWWLVLFAGLMGVAAGVIVLAKPAGSLATLAVVAGIFLLVDGAFEVLAALLGGGASRALVALLGVVSFVLGALLIRHPIAGVLAVALLVGLWLIAAGTIRLVAAFERPDHRLSHAALALFELAAGIVIVAVPAIGYATLALFVGVAFIVQGVGTVALGWLMHDAHREATGPRHHAGAAPA